MIEPRIYRAAFVPALLAVVLTMFSFQSRPRPLEQGLAADVLFDGNQATTLATRIVAESPDRRPGTPGNRATAQLVADTFAARGFGGGEGQRPVVQRFSQAGRDLNTDSFIRALESAGEISFGKFAARYSPNSHSGSSYVELAIIDNEGKLRY